MRNTLQRIWILVLCCAPLLVSAQGPINIEQRLSPEQMHATGLDTLTPAQLAQLNLVLRDNAPQAKAPSPGGEDEQHSFFQTGLDDKPIHTRVRGEVPGWGPGTVFVMVNGQQWKVLKGRMTLRTPLHSPEIQLVPGISGRWFLQVDEDTPKPRVYRIR
jgi:hypothetical protein